MNCFEFKRIALSDPYSEDQGFVAHGKECDDCGKHVANILTMDNNLRDALSVKAPDDLKARLKLRQVLEKEKVKHKRFRKFAYAASLAMTTGLATLAYQNHQLNDQYLAFHNAVVDHVAYEESSLTSVQPTAPSRMKAHLASLTGKEVDELPGLRYSQLCPVLGKDTWHAVMQTNTGEVVTLVFFNNETLPKKSIQKDGWESTVVPASNGDVLLLGKSQQALKFVSEQLADKVII